MYNYLLQSISFENHKVAIWDLPWDERNQLGSTIVAKSIANILESGSFQV